MLPFARDPDEELGETREELRGEQVRCEESPSPAGAPVRAEVDDANAYAISRLRLVDEKGAGKWILPLAYRSIVLVVSVGVECGRFDDLTRMHLERRLMAPHDGMVSIRLELFWIHPLLLRRAIIHRKPQQQTVNTT